MSGEGQETFTASIYWRELTEVFFGRDSTGRHFAILALIPHAFVIAMLFFGFENGASIGLIIVYLFWWPLIACYFHRYLIMGETPYSEDWRRLPFFRYFLIGVLVSLAISFAISILSIPIAASFLFLLRGASDTQFVLANILIGFIMLVPAYYVGHYLWKFALWLPKTALQHTDKLQYRPLAVNDLRKIGLLATILFFGTGYLPQTLSFIETGSAFFQLIIAIFALLGVVIGFLVGVVTLSIFYKHLVVTPAEPLSNKLQDINVVFKE